MRYLWVLLLVTGCGLQEKMVSEAKAVAKEAAIEAAKGAVEGLKEAGPEIVEDLGAGDWQNALTTTGAALLAGAIAYFAGNKKGKKKKK
jgi:hypothetical protein